MPDNPNQGPTHNSNASHWRRLHPEWRERELDDRARAQAHEFDGCCDKRLGNGCTCPCHTHRPLGTS